MVLVFSSVTHFFFFVKVAKIISNRIAIEIIIIGFAIALLFFLLDRSFCLWSESDVLCFSHISSHVLLQFAAVVLFVRR